MKPATVQMSGAGGSEADQQPAAGWQPGLLLNTFTGGIAAVLSWGLYGPLAESNLLNLGAIPAEINVLTPSALVGAFFVGYGRSRWLSTEADKRVLKTSNSVTGDSAATVASGAATAANGAATLASNAAELAMAAAAENPHLKDQASQLKNAVGQVRDQAQELQEQSEQIKEQAQAINAGQTVQNILNTAQGITKRAGKVEKSGDAIVTIADKHEQQMQ